jgi:hypothetical protein
VLPSTVDRIAIHTSDDVNGRIAGNAEDRISYFATHPGQIDVRLAELDREWDIERLFAMIASVFALAGIGLGVFVNMGWLAASTVVLLFLFQHATRGSCPVVSVFRRLGGRTSREIHVERVALKILRGDFGSIGLEGTDSETLMSQAIEMASS